MDLWKEYKKEIKYCSFLTKSCNNPQRIMQRLIKKKSLVLHKIKKLQRSKDIHIWTCCPQVVETLISHFQKKTQKNKSLKHIASKTFPDLLWCLNSQEFWTFSRNALRVEETNSDWLSPFEKNQWSCVLVLTPKFLRALTSRRHHLHHYIKSKRSGLTQLMVDRRPAVAPSGFRLHGRKLLEPDLDPLTRQHS